MTVWHVVHLQYAVCLRQSHAAHNTIQATCLDDSPLFIYVLRLNVPAGVCTSCFFHLCIAITESFARLFELKSGCYCDGLKLQVVADLIPPSTKDGGVIHQTWRMGSSSFACREACAVTCSFQKMAPLPSNARANPRSPPTKSKQKQHAS